MSSQRLWGVRLGLVCEFELIDSECEMLLDGGGHRGQVSRWEVSPGVRHVAMTSSSGLRGEGREVNEGWDESGEEGKGGGEEAAEI